MGDTIFTLTSRGSSGGSTGFSYVAEGTNTITVKQTSTSASVSVGSLGSFQKGISKNYAMNIRTVSGSYCAELWQRLDTNSNFDDNTTRVLISTTCGGSSSPTTLASWSGGIYFFGIAVDPTNVYFADYSSSGTINKVAKE